MADKDAFDLWWEWATKDRATDYRTIDAKIHNVVMMLTPEERADRRAVVGRAEMLGQARWRGTNSKGLGGSLIHYSLPTRRSIVRRSSSRRWRRTMAKHGPDEGWRQHVLNNVLTRMEATTEQATGFTPAPANPQPFSVGMHLQPAFDVIELLPEERKDLFRKLRQHSEDKHAVIPEFEKIREASVARISAENDLKRLTDSRLHVKPTDRQVIAAQRTLDKATADFRRLQELQEVRTAAWQTASQAKAACEDWLRHGVPGNCRLEAVEVKPPKLNKGESLTDAIERLRRRARELKADLHRIASAPFPSACAKQQMREQIEALAMQGAPSVSLLIEHDGKILWPMRMMRSEVRGGEHPALAFAETLDAVALTCWLHKSALIAALDHEIASEADDKAALTHEARQKAEAELNGDLLAVERDESALVFKAWTEGLPCEHRADISPVALLGLRLVTAPRAAPPPTSPEHGYNIIGGRR